MVDESKIRKLGEPEITFGSGSSSEDVNLSYDTVMNKIGVNVEMAYKTLAAALSFENGDSIAAEDYTSAGGANGCVNTGSTTALFSADHYTLINKFNLSSAIYTGKSKATETEDSTFEGMFIGNNGTKMYMYGNTGNDVFQYTLSTAWDINTASYDSIKKDVGYSIPSDIWFKPDGTEMYVLTQSLPAGLYTWTLSTPWNVSTATVQGDSILVAASTVECFSISSDGTKIYIVDGVNVSNYTLSTAWDLSTSVLTDTFNPVEMTGMGGITINSTGTKMFITNLTTIIYEYSLSTPFDLTTISYTGISYDSTTQTGAIRSIQIAPDDIILYVGDQTLDTIYQYTVGLEDAPSGSSVVCDTNTLAIDSETNAFALHWQGDFPTGTSGSFDLSDGGDPLSEFDISSTGETEHRGMVFDGTYFYVIGINTDKVYEFDFNWNYTGNNFSTLSEMSSAHDITFDGTYLWVLSFATDAIHKYSTSGVYQSLSIDVSSQTTSPVGLTFDGTYFYVIGGNFVYKYDSTGIFQTSFDISSTGINLQYLEFFNNNFYTVDITNKKIFEMDSSFVSTGVFGIIDSTEANARGLCDDTTYIYNNGATNDKSVQYSATLKRIENEIVINLPVNSTTKKTGVISKGALTNVDNVVIKQKLETTDTSVTPTANGFSIIKL